MVWSSAKVRRMAIPGRAARTAQYRAGFIAGSMQEVSGSNHQNGEGGFMSISASEFVKLCCKNNGINEHEFYENYIPMPDVCSRYGWAPVPNNPSAIKKHVDIYMGDASTERPAYEIKQFGYFVARMEDWSIKTEFNYFITDIGTSPQHRRDEMVPKYFLQGVINSLQNHCDEMTDEALPVIYPTQGV